MSKDKVSPQAEEAAIEDARVTTQLEAASLASSVVTEEVSPEGQAIDRAISHWVRSRLSNSALSRNTPAWNLLTKELPTLRNLILKGVQ